jgi:hypothetical protein
MSEEEWRQVRRFIQHHTEREAFNGYRYKLTTIRDLDTGKQIRTIKLVEVSHIEARDAWTPEEARRYFGLPEVSTQIAKRPTDVIFNLDRIAKLGGLMR